VTIAFVSDRDGQNDDIYLMDLDGNNVTPLTNADVGDSSPTWSPNATMIAFGRDAGGGDRDIYVVDVAGGTETYLTTETAFWWGISWSPDSSQIAFVTERDGDPDIYVMDADGGGQTALTTDNNPDYGPSWAQGGLIFFTAERGNGDPEIYSMTEAGASETNLTNNTMDDHYPVASPDGGQVVFRRIEGGIRDLIVMTATGSAPVPITGGVGLVTYNFYRWSPSGSYIAFTTSAGVDRIIHRADFEGTELIPLTDTQSQNESASWTPDSQQLVFTSDRDGDEGEIYIMDADGENQTRLTKDPAFDHSPVASPSG
jgi:Tol biopolymer transport system component